MSDKLHDARSFHVFMPARFDDLPLTLEAHRVYCHLVRRADKYGKAFPKISSIGEHCFRGSYPNSSEASLKAKTIAAIKELCAYGLIRKEIQDEGEGYRHNNYFLTDSREWKTEEDEIDLSTCNIRKGRVGLTRAKRKSSDEDNQVNGVNPEKEVNQDNQVNGVNLTGLTGLTSGVNRAIPYKGISNEGNPEEGNPDLLCVADAAHQGGEDKKGKKRSRTAASEYTAKLKWFNETFCVHYPYRLQEGGGKSRQMGQVVKNPKKYLDGIPVKSIEDGSATEALRSMIRAGIEKYKAQNNGQKPPRVQPKGSTQWVYALPFIPDPVNWFKECRWMSEYVGAEVDSAVIAADGGLVNDEQSSQVTASKHFDIAREKGIAIAKTAEGVVYLSDDSMMPWAEFAAKYPVEKLQEMSDAGTQVKRSV